MVGKRVGVDSSCANSQEPRRARGVIVIGVTIIHPGAAMDESTLNIDTRRFLKEVGVTSQREIESAVREAVRSGKLKGNERLRARMTLTVEAVGLRHEVEGEIQLE